MFIGFLIRLKILTKTFYFLFCYFPDFLMKAIRDIKDDLYAEDVAADGFWIQTTTEICLSAGKIHFGRSCAFFSFGLFF